MMTLHGVPKISDFGLAKRVLDARGRPVADGICGTPNFMAPELFQGEIQRIANNYTMYAGWFREVKSEK